MSEEASASPEEGEASVTTPIEDVSSNSSPESLSSAANDEGAVGGSSAGLTQGEIIFVTSTTFVVVLAIVVASYVYWRHRQRKAQDKKLADQQRPSSREGSGTELTNAVDCEAGLKGGSNEGTDPTNAKVLQLDRGGSHGSLPPGTGSTRRASLDGTTLSQEQMMQTMSRKGSGNYRRASTESGSSGHNRRASLDSGRSGSNRGGQRRATLDGSATLNSMGPDVSSQYKRAAIEHMNKISQTGQHN